MKIVFVKLVKEHKNGSATYEISYDKQFEDFVKKHCKVKKPTKKHFQKVIIEGLKNFIEKEK